MRTVIQKRIIKLIQPEIVEYYCDKCNHKFKKGERKRTIYCEEKIKHYCKKCDKYE